MGTDCWLWGIRAGWLLGVGGISTEERPMESNDNLHVYNKNTKNTVSIFSNFPKPTMTLTGTCLKVSPSQLKTQASTLSIVVIHNTDLVIHYEQELSNYETQVGYCSCVFGRQQRNPLTYRYTIGMVAWNLTPRAPAVNSGSVRRKFGWRPSSWVAAPETEPYPDTLNWTAPLSGPAAPS